MKVLILDHHFRQDIEALVDASNAEDVIRVIPAELFAHVAHGIFPPEVFGADYSRYHAPELADVRAAYRGRARQILFDLYKTFPFDVFVVPSDIYFYIRDVIEAVRDLGIATVAVQKESGVSAQSFVQEAADIRRWFPFSGDIMSVCSERSREFWLAAGVSEDRILVLGQPRFDVYRNGNGSMLDLKATFGKSFTDERPILVFLSYSLDAYAETRELDGLHRPWDQLHNETESALLELARQGRYTVLIKPHPQQDAQQLAALAERIIAAPNVFMLPPKLDTRRLIMASDVVVGFQTTAIAEAMMAGKRVVYTFWTSPVERAKPLLLPFHEMADAIDVATSAEDFSARLSRADDHVSSAVRVLREQYCEPYTGRVDGHSSDRVWQQALRRWEGRELSPLAERLGAEAKAYCAGELRRARRRAAAWHAVSIAVRTVPRFRGVAKRAERRRISEQLRIRECLAGMNSSYSKIESLRGPRYDGSARDFGASAERAAGGVAVA